MNSADSAMNQYCDEEAMFYIQVPCIIPKESIIPRRIKGLVIASIAVFVIVFSMVYI